MSFFKCFLLCFFFLLGFNVLEASQIVKNGMNNSQNIVNTIWYSPFTCSTIPIHGRCWNDEIGKSYQRLPQRAINLVRKPVWNLSKQTAGMYLKFNTNATSIQIKYQVTGGFSMPHMPATGVSGVDLYAKDNDGKIYWCAAEYQFGDTISYTYKDLTYDNTLDKGYEFTLYFPLYNGVKSLQIGVPEGSLFDFVYPSYENPIIVYGTSIAQGACASRPGMAWTNILQRKLDMSVVNLGFSGNANLDENVFRLLAEVNAAVYIIDCMPNMSDEKVCLIKSRLKKGIEILREKNNTPIILVEHDGYMGYHISSNKEVRFRDTNEELRSVYDSMKSKVDNLYYISFEELGLGMDSQVDGVHATDYGMIQYADAYYKKIVQVLNSGLQD